MKLATVGASAQIVGTSSSFLDNSFDLSQARLAVQGVVTETEDLLKQNLLLREQIRSITAALADARIETDSLAAENQTLNLRIEALGLSAANGDRSKIEQRLIKALSDLRIAQNDAAKAREHLAGLTSAILPVLKTASGVELQSRIALETQLRASSQDSNTVGGATNSEDSSLTDARVISIKSEFGLVVGNLGARQGVKIGMPFHVLNGDREVALIHAVDVRDEIFGGLVQEQLTAEVPLKIGQRLKIAAQNP